MTRIVAGIRTAAFLLAMALGFAGPAGADVITFRFEAAITNVSQGLQGQFHSGGRAEWFVTYDTAMAEDPDAGNLADPAFGGYYRAFTWRGRFDGYDTGSDGIGWVRVYDADGSSTRPDSVQWVTNDYGLSNRMLGDALTAGGAERLPWIFSTWLRMDPTTLGSDALPNSLGLPVGDSRFSLYFSDANLDSIQDRVDGEIRSVQKVPEPGTLMLAAAGLLTAGLLGRRRWRARSDLH